MWIRKNHLTFHNLNNADLFHILKIVLDQSLSREEARKAVTRYADENHVDRTVLMTVAGAVNCKIDYDALSKRGEFRMCTLFEEIARESEARGEARGEAKGIIGTGLEFGLTESDILDRLKRKLNISSQEAQEYLNLFGDRLNS